MSRRRTTAATSSAGRSAGRSPPIGCSSSPTTRARGCAKASPRDERADRGRAAGRFLAVAVARAGQSVHAASRFRAVAFRLRVQARSVGDRGAVSAAEPQRAVRQLRVLANRHATTSTSSTARSITRSPAASRLTARYSFSDRRLLEPFAGAGVLRVPGFGNNVDRRGQNLASAYNRPCGHRAGERRALRLQPRRHRGVQENPQIDNRRSGLKPSPPTRGMPAELHLGRRLLAARAGVQQPPGEHVRHVPVRDTATWARGPHLVKFGGRIVRDPASAPTATCRRAASSLLNQGYTGNALADLLLGLPVLTGGAHLDNPQHLRTQTWSLVRPGRLARALADALRRPALRLHPPPVDADDRANLYDPATGQLVAVGTGGMPRGGYEPDRNNLAPRAGFAWTLDQSARTVCAAATASTTTRGRWRTSEGLYFNPPYFNLERLLPGARAAAPHARRSVPVVVPDFHPAVGDRVFSAICRRRGWSTGTSTCSGSSASRAVEVAYVGLARPRLISARDLNQPAAEPDVAQPAAESAVRRHHVHRVAGLSEIQQPADQVSAAHLDGPVDAAAYTLGKSTDDASGFFTERGRSELPAEQPGPRGRAGPFELRRAAPFLGRLRWTCPLRRGPAVLGALGHRKISQVSGVVDASRAGGRSPWRCCRRSTTATPARSNLGFGYNDRPDCHRRSRARRPDRRALVRHRRVLVAGLRHVRQRRPEHGRRSRAMQNVNLA